MSKLDVFDSSYYGGAVIAWVCEDGGIGTVLGEVGDSSDHETRLAEEAIRGSGIDCGNSSRAFVFESERDARRALRAARAAVKAGKVWPEWATTAVANGWSPPKGWKP